MKKVLISIAGLLLLFVLIFQFIPIQSIAAGNFDTGYYDPNNNHADGAVGKTTATILGTALTAVQWAGTAIAVIMLITLGAKYLSGGVDDKSTVKKNTIAYAIGAGIFFGGTILVSIIKNFVLGNLKAFIISFIPTSCATTILEEYL